jgi:hypothetical protein
LELENPLRLGIIFLSSSISKPSTILASILTLLKQMVHYLLQISYFKLHLSVSCMFYTIFIQ